MPYALRTMLVSRNRPAVFSKVYGMGQWEALVGTLINAAATAYQIKTQTSAAKAALSQQKKEFAAAQAAIAAENERRAQEAKAQEELIKAQAGAKSAELQAKTQELQAGGIIPSKYKPYVYGGIALGIGLVAWLIIKKSKK